MDSRHGIPQGQKGAVASEGSRNRSRAGFGNAAGRDAAAMSEVRSPERAQKQNFVSKGNTEEKNMLELGEKGVLLQRGRQVFRSRIADVLFRQTATSEAYSIQSTSPGSLLPTCAVSTLSPYSLQLGKSGVVALEALQVHAPELRHAGWKRKLPQHKPSQSYRRILARVDI